MKKTDKILIIVLAILVLLVIIGILILKGNNKVNNNTNNQTSSNIEQKLTSNNLKVNQITDAKKLYNLQKVVNNELELIYEDNAYPENYPTKDIQLESLKDFDIEENLKKFYIETGYELNCKQLSTYFIEGYLILDDIDKISNKNIEKQEVKLTVVKYNSANKFLIDKYANSFKYSFKYDENDISKTEVFDLTEDELFLSLITDNLMFESVDLDKDVTDTDYAFWYFEDYQNRKLFKDQNKEEYKNAKLQRFNGNIKDGYKLIDNHKKEIDIKPNQKPMKYEFQE